MKRALLLIISAFLLVGCSRSFETNDLAYVVAIGIDKGEEETYDFTLQIANPQAISGGSDEKGGEGGKETVSNLTVTAPNIYSAVNIANHIYSKNVSLAHTKLIVVAEEIARGEGLKKLAETIARNEEIRPSTYLSVAKKAAKDYLEKIKPTNEVNPVKYYEVIYESDYSGYIPKHSCRDFYIRSLSTESENVLPLSAAMEENEEKGTQNNEYDGFEYLMKNYTAGNIEVQGDIKTQVCGMAVFKDDVMIAEAGAVEAELYNMLCDRYERSEITYRAEKDADNAVSVIQTLEKSTQIEVEMEGDKPKIKVNLYLEADLRTVSQRYIIEEEQADFERQVTEQVEDALEKFLYKTAREYESDIVGFGSYIKKNFNSFDEFEKFDWQEKYKNAEFEANVNFHLRRSGLINKKKGT